MEGPDKTAVEKMIAAALEEDGARFDATVKLVGIGDERAGADVIAGGAGVVCGVGIAKRVFQQMDPAIEFETLIRDGASCMEDGVICSLAGPARSILAAERVALNFIQRLSGISSLAATFVGRVAGTGVTILDTRKTTPLWRDLEKYAVRCGGAENHRRDLRAMVLVKENHVRVAGGPNAFIERLKKFYDDPSAERGFVEVEVDSLDFLDKILEIPIDRVMLDNFTPEQVVEALKVVASFKRRQRGADIEVEVSGGVTLDNVDTYALEGVDYISIGALTHSAPALSMSLEVR